MAEILTLRAQGIAWRAIEREVVVLDLHTSQYFSINGSGSILWQLLAKGATRGELTAVLKAEYAIDPDLAGEDVESFLGALDSHGMLCQADS